MTTGKNDEISFDKIKDTCFLGSMTKFNNI